MNRRLLLIPSIALCWALAPGCALADCYDDAAQYHHVNHWILRAIAWVESHNHPDARHANANGSTDFGLMQINSTHLPTLKNYGVSADTLMQGCPNVYVAAWVLRQQMDRYGNTWAAVGAYHSQTPAKRDAYAAQVAAVLKSWHVAAP